MNSEEKRDDSSLDKKQWGFCPSCGNKLLRIERQRFCIKCGLDLDFLKSNAISHPLSTPILEILPDRQDLKIKKISDEDLLNLGGRKLWSSFISIGIPIAAFIIMNFLAAVITLLFLPSILNLEDIGDLILNPYFVIILSFTELIFLLVPVLYVGKYLKNPKFKNRLTILGFSFKGYDNIGVIKEVLIGLGFAILGIFLVAIISLFVEFILELIFGVDIVYSAGGALNEIDVIISNSDILALIFLAITMILIIGTSEEVLFRGFMQKGLVRRVGKIGGIIITALIFSLIHLLGIFFMSYTTPVSYVISFLLNFFPYFAISVLLGVLFYWRKENLIAVIINHGFYNALTIIIAYIYFNFI